ncbi:molybdopterin molybdotransferase MoeA [Fictibacillus enclensis]|uniref:molybdopterin molybdotransferase MoeA n=1 Tax=Fictibacillus enclensis TaxID=1017270 RepID=UPI0025A0863B|nr:gephyrin-like molybdotransferase Glp [Fictibacillus enclensis]MDM5337794.1 molybdopterin molybdotransferase MoeA [Fictibacillus enclensis]
MPIEKREIIQVWDAVKKVLKYQLKLPLESVTLEESDGRYLGEDVLATHDVPPFDRSPYDGFAIRAEDTAGASRDEPVELNVIDSIGAGHVSKKEIKQNEAVRIMTGAAIPKGANAVIMLELVSEKENNMISISRKVEAGDNISVQGEDTPEGTTILKKGTRIHAGVTAVLATFGYHTVKVFKKPVVGILATGTELLDVDEDLVPGKIRNSNAYMIASQIKKMGGEPQILGKLPDDFDETYAGILKAMEKTDLVITTGGVSVGDFDHLPAIYKKMGADLLFNKIAMRPGSVTSAAVFEGKLLFGLSGNPSACFVGCELFVRPYLLGSLNAQKVHLGAVTSILQKDYPKPNPFTRFVRGRVEWNATAAAASPVGLDKSGSVSSLSEANALIVLPGGTRGWEKGSQVMTLLLDGEGSVWPWDQALKSRS